ncbi:hypothetical protein A5757_01760 [Mycobacterium sp. 852013-51886_SCH5428379]|nr:hypothetical protein A5757_01760 [Mycobacterium sp. 852013-51886_SCH5428379]
MRRWLQLGAASAGVGAALLGWSLVGSEIGVASADGVEGSASASAGPAASPSKGVDSGSSSTAGTHSRRDSGGPASAPRRAAPSSAPSSAAGENAAGEADSDNAPAKVVSRSDRDAPAGSTSVANRFANSTSLSSRMASRSAGATPAAGGGPMATMLSAFTPKPPAPQPNLQPSAKVTFEFEYTDDGEYWTPELKRGLEDAANTLAATYFIVDRPVTLTYRVNGENDPEKLAAAGSEPFARNPGFDNVVVQEKLLSGLDLNGLQADGEIDWSFAEQWSAQPKPTTDQYDLTSTAMHELLHSFGWLSFINEPGKNATNREYTIYDSHIVNENGVRLVNSDYRFDEEQSEDLIGFNGGTYFAGRNAVAAYGMLVPLFTPEPWQGGSSLSHLDDVTFSRANGNFQMMTSADGMGPGPKTLSRIEQGVLADIGYNIRFQDPAPYAPVYGMTLVGFLFLRRKKRPGSED